MELPDFIMVVVALPLSDEARLWYADKQAKRDATLNALSTDTDANMRRKLRASARRYMAMIVMGRNAREREPAIRAAPSLGALIRKAETAAAAIGVVDILSEHDEAARFRALNVLRALLLRRRLKRREPDREVGASQSGIVGLVAKDADHRRRSHFTEARSPAD